MRYIRYLHCFISDHSPGSERRVLGPVLDRGEPGVEAVDRLRISVLVPEHEARTVPLLFWGYVARLEWRESVLAPFWFGILSAIFSSLDIRARFIDSVTKVCQ